MKLSKFVLLGVVALALPYASTARAEDAPKQPPVVEEVPGPQVQYKDGQLSLEFDNGGFGLSNRLQLRFTDQLPNDSSQLPGTLSPGTSKGSFRIRRYEPQVQGWIYSKKLTFKIEFAFQDLQNNSVKGGVLNDAFFAYDFSGQRKALRVQVGQFKVPFGRQEMTSSFSLQFVDRSIVASEYERGRDIGVQIDGLAFNRKVEWRAGLFNGNGRNASANDNGTYQVDARVTVQPFGDARYSEADFESKNRPLVAVAAQFERADFRGLGGSSTPSRLESCPCGSGDAFTRQVLGGDVVFKYRGLGVTGSLYRREITPAAQPGFRSDGFSIEAGYLLGSARRVQVAARYASWDPTNQVQNDQRSERGLALNWFYNRHFAKVQADFRELKDRFTQSTDRELRIQTQLSF